MIDIHIDFNEERENGVGTKDNPYGSGYTYTEADEVARFLVQGAVEANQLEPILTNYGSKSTKPLIFQGYTG